MFELRYYIRARHLYDEDMCESREDLNPILQYRQRELKNFAGVEFYSEWSEWKDVETVRMK